MAEIEAINARVKQESQFVDAIRAEVARTIIGQSYLVDRLLIYRAPILIGEGKPGVGAIGLEGLADAHGRWALTETRQLGSDTLQVYERQRASAGKAGTALPSHDAPEGT